MNKLFSQTVAAATTTVAAVIAATAFSLPAVAQEATYDYPQVIVVAKSRAEVKAELAAARADGQLYVAEAGYSFGDAHNTARRAAAPAMADLQPKAKAAPRVRAEVNTSNFEPQSFDGVVTAAGGATSARATRVN